MEEEIDQRPDPWDINYPPNESCDSKIGYRDFYILYNAKQIENIDKRLDFLKVHLKKFKQNIIVKEYDYNNFEVSITEEIKYLEDNQKLLEIVPPPQPVTEQPKLEISLTKNIIITELDSIDTNLRWEYAFNNKDDYNTFLNLLTDYFEYGNFELPKKVIRLKRDCKTRLAKVLSPIHKQLSDFPMKSDTEFFKIIRILNHFKDLTDVQIYDSLTK